MVMTSCLCCGQNFIHETKIITIQLAYSKSCLENVLIVIHLLLLLCTWPKKFSFEIIVSYLHKCKNISLKCFQIHNSNNFTFSIVCLSLFLSCIILFQELFFSIGNSIHETTMFLYLFLYNLQSMIGMRANFDLI